MLFETGRTDLRDVPMQLFDVDNVALCAIVTACLQFAFFVVVCKIHIQKVVDIAGGITFCAVALVSLCIGQVRVNLF